jgi:hypothetical protein
MNLGKKYVIAIKWDINNDMILAMGIMKKNSVNTRLYDQADLFAFQYPDNEKPR